MMYIQLKNMMGKGKKTLGIFDKKQKINPVWFPSHPPFYDEEIRLFSGIQTGPKISRTISIGEGA